MPKDAIDELVARSKDHRETKAFHRFHRQQPEVLDFLVREIQARLDKGFPAFSIGSLWDYCRWKLELRAGPSSTYKMNDHLAPMYGRAILILHPEYNGMAELRGRRDGGQCVADQIFGTKIAEGKRRAEDRERRLVWADGKAIEAGWRPSQPHVATLLPTCRPDIHAREVD